MRYGLLTLGLLLMAWLGFVMALQSNRNSILGLNARLKAEADYSPEYWHKEWQRLGVAARERALLYEQELEKDHLLDAMVVNRHRDGRVASECDSLLFSSLRYVALLKLGWQDKADAAWQGIEGAYQKGRWARHPKCQDRSTSRDMIVGLLVALSQHPPRDRQHLQTLLDIVRDTGGSIDDGPFYVSRLSPGIGEIIRLMAVNHSIPLNNLPDEIRLGFSTLELDVLTANIGFTSHLNALCLWIELELRNEAVSTPIRNLSEVLDALGL
ncbi:MAG: hypothetical protein NTX25_13940, partial [Proteobacteria bacterium]|nr:hypothetical protein [Pseudomonadota bacterium]